MRNVCGCAVASALLALVLCAQEVDAVQQSAPRLVSEGSVTVNGIDQYYRIYGEGPPVLLLHGLTNTWRVWQPFLAEFGKDYRLIVPDLRGHGRTSNSTNQLIA